MDEDQLGELPSSRSGKMDNLLSLPETLRKRSSRMVDNLELGTPLGRGSYGKVYKGEPATEMHCCGSVQLSLSLAHRCQGQCCRPHVLIQKDKLTLKISL